MTNQELFDMTFTERDALPTYKGNSDMRCPKCNHYNAMLAAATRAGYVLQCRDCGYVARPENK